MQRRTPVLIIIIRFYLLVLAVFYCVKLLADWTGGEGLIGWPLLFMVPIYTTGMFVLFGWPICTIITEIVYYGDPMYKLAKTQTGYRPYWDTLPKLLNPSADGWNGPRIKCGICPRCESMLDVDPSKPTVCPNCGYGSDGDYSAYFAKYGYVRPAGMSDADWNAILAQDQRGCSNGTCSINTNDPDDWQPMGN